MNRTTIETRRANAVARIKAIREGSPVTGNWNNPQHCINANEAMIKDCDRRLGELS